VPRYPFPRRLRLLSPEDFRRVFQQARRATSPGLVVLARRNDLGHPRLGLAVSRKSLPLAVQRNRVKRMAREVLRHRQHDLGGVDFIILTRRGLKLKDWRRQDRERLRQTLDTHLTALASQCE